MTSLEHRRIWEKCAHQGGCPTSIDRAAALLLRTIINPLVLFLSAYISEYSLVCVCVFLPCPPFLEGGASACSEFAHTSGKWDRPPAVRSHPEVRAVGALLLTHRTRNTQQNVRGTTTALSFLVYRPCYDLANHWCRQRCVCIFDAR